MLINFKELFPKYNIKPKGVLHLGANVGEEAPVYDELGIKTVVWVEANPEIFSRLEANLEPYPDQIAMNICVGDTDGKDVTFHVSNNASQSSSILELGTHKQQHPDVFFTHDIKMKTHRMDTYFKGGFLDDIDFLNMDLQGAEMMALKGLGSLIHQFKWIYMEVNVNEVYQGCSLLPEFDAVLSEFGFRRVETKMCGGWGDALYIK